MRDVEPMLQLIAHWARRGAMLPKSRDVLYKEIRDFYLLETQDASIAGTVGLHILWSDLSEVGTILPRLKTCNSSTEVAEMVHQEFVQWFFPEVAGGVDRYSIIGAEIWELWQSHLTKS